MEGEFLCSLAPPLMEHLAFGSSGSLVSPGWPGALGLPCPLQGSECFSRVISSLEWGGVWLAESE